MRTDGRERALRDVKSLIIFLTVFLALDASAQQLPEQLVHPPLLAPARSDSTRAIVELELSVFDFPDGRRGEDYRLLSQWRPRERHRLFFELHYVGIESDSSRVYAGGPLAAGWSVELPRVLGLHWGSDTRVVLPTGDGDFHPLSAKAPSIEWNFRGGRWTEGGHGLWVSWWARRVSQPTDRVDPQRFFPSGSGATVHADLSLGDTTLRLLARQDLGGNRAVSYRDADGAILAHQDLSEASSALWLGARASHRIAEELLLGGSFAISSPGESADERLFDRSWSVFFRWSPRPLVAP